MLYAEQEHIKVVKLQYTEEELVSLIKVGDKDAFSYLYDKYSKALFGVIYTIVGSQEEAEDVLQNVFIKIWNGFFLYNPDKGRLYTWMLNISRNASIDYRRSKQNKTNFQDLTEDIISEEIDKSYHHVSRVDHIGLQTLLKELSADQKKIIDLAYFEGYTQTEIAEKLDIPVGTVKTKARQAIIILRKVLK